MLPLVIAHRSEPLLVTVSPVNELPDWMRPPRPEGWLAEDLDRLPDAPRHTELIDGALVFMMSPQRIWPSEVVSELRHELRRQRPDGVSIRREITVRLDERNRSEPDVIAVQADAHELDGTGYDASDVVLAVEVVSPESAFRDRTVKLAKYANARIPHYWIVEDEEGKPAVHVYELDQPTSAYVAMGIFRGTLRVEVPFAIEIDLDGLLTR
jgi:Uma2 family endonuclease